MGERAATVRDLVTARLAARAKRFPDLGPEPFNTPGLDPRDATLAHAIDQAIARRWLTLVAILQAHLTRPWEQVEPPLQAVLLVGAAQLLLLERIPDHAAIHQAVEWAKRNIRPGAGGLVNAVLRKVAASRGEIVSTFDESRRDEMPLADGRALRFDRPVFADDAVRRLAEQTSHAPGLLAHWTAAFGASATRELAMHSLVHAPTIVHQLNRSETLAHPLLAPHAEPGFHVFEGDRAQLVELLSAREAIVQDPASAAPIAATSRLSPAVIIDVCAGQGTKTRQLAAAHPQARVIATDIDASRRATLRAQAEGHASIHVVEPAELHDFREQADLLVLDVPCSNTGVLARRPEAKYRASSASIEKLAELQRQIIADSIPLLARSGVLLYATCSLEPAENESQARWIAKWHRMRVVASATRLPRGQPGDPPREYTDGGHFALLTRDPAGPVAGVNTRAG